MWSSRGINNFCMYVAYVKSIFSNVMRNAVFTFQSGKPKPGENKRDNGKANSKK